MPETESIQHTHTHQGGGRTPRTSNIHSINLDSVFRPADISRYLETLDHQQMVVSTSSTVSDPTQNRSQSSRELWRKSSSRNETFETNEEADPTSTTATSTPARRPDRHYHHHGHGRAFTDTGVEGGLRRSPVAGHGLKHRRGDPSPPPPPLPSNGFGEGRGGVRRHPRSASLPMMSNNYYPSSPVPQRQTVRLIDLIDEEFVVNSGALGKIVTTSKTNHPNRPRLSSCPNPRLQRRRKSILDMMDRIDQLDSAGCSVRNNNNNSNNEDNWNKSAMIGQDTVSTKSSFSSFSSSSSLSSASSSNFMTSRSYPRGVYIVPYNADDDEQSSTRRRSLTGTVALVSSEAFQYWNE
jgi:hypothetical protein